MYQSDIDTCIMRYIKKLCQCIFCITVIFYTVLIFQTRQEVISSPDASKHTTPPPLVADDSNYIYGSESLGAGGGELPLLPLGPLDSLTSSFMTSSTSLSLSDIFIAVKTTVTYHKTRLPPIINTWFQLAKNQTWFFTDTDDEQLQDITNGHMVNTKCHPGHMRKPLCCKTSVEFDTYLESNKKWFCHFDDDNYVNVPRLVTLLSDYNPQEDWYLGKRSIKTPLKILNREGKNKTSKQQFVKFWFGTGGAGYCISRALALKMSPIASGGKFISICEKIRLPDDCTMGYIIEHRLQRPMTVIDEFHSHLEPMKFLHQDKFSSQVTFSYMQYAKDVVNRLNIESFDTSVDPTRFLSLHCLLFPYFTYCPK